MLIRDGFLYNMSTCQLPPGLLESMVLMVLIPLGGEVGRVPSDENWTLVEGSPDQVIVGAGPQR